MNNFKKIISTLLVFGALIVLCSCSFDAGKMSASNEPSFDEGISQSNEDKSDNNEDEKEKITTTTTTQAPKKTAAELQVLIDQQEVKVVSTDYIVQDNEFKSLYPDLLSAVVRNDSKQEIKNLMIAYVAWDKNNLPVKIIGQYDYDGGSYLNGCSMVDANMIPGMEYGRNSGLALSDDCNNIHTFKAIVVKYETFDGEEWENPYAEEWEELYAGKKLVE